MIKFFERLLNLIYIQPCYFCGSTKSDKLICENCLKKINYLPVSVFRRENNCNIYAVTLYNGIIKNLIISLKYKNKKRLAKIQAEIMYNYWKKLNLKEDYIIIPVPIHKSRLKERHYNHMDLVAKNFSKLSGYKAVCNFLLRITDTKKQYKLHKQDRINNIKNAFNINKSKRIELSKNLLILDDITSSGATINEIIRILNLNGYKKITALTLSTPDIWN